MGGSIAIDMQQPPVDQERLEIILLKQWASHLALPVFVAGTDGQLLFYNEPAEKLIGRRYDEAGEMPLAQLADLFRTKTEDGNPMDSSSLPLGIALLEGRPDHKRFRMLGLDARWRMIEATAFPIEVQRGQRLGAVSIFWETDVV